MSRNYKAIAIGVVVLLVAAWITSTIWMPFLPFFEERQAGEETIQQTYDAESAIQDYREFRSLYQEIRAQRDVIGNVIDEEEQFHETYGDDPSEWSRTAEERHTRLHQRITGNRNQLERLVAEYNAMSSDASRELFKCHLPYQVDERFRIRGPPGSGQAEQPSDTTIEGERVDAAPPPAEECDGLPSRVES